MRTEIAGTEATMMGGFDRYTPVTEYSREGVRHDHAFWFPQRFGQAYRDELRAWIENLAAGRPLTPNGEDGRKALVLALAAQESATHGGSAVKVDL